MRLADLWKTFIGSEKRGLGLLRTVQANMPEGTDEADVKIIAAIVGLLGQVAYADRPYLPAEERRIRHELGSVRGLSAAGADAICQTLRQSIMSVAEVEAHEYAKFLCELAERDLRLRVLDLLLDVAAADDAISVVEVNLIRRLTDVLGLTQAEYNASQQRHKDKLTALRGRDVSSA